MQNKDTMGDKLRDKGKAAEDLFIQEQERKRLERRKAAEAAAKSALVCPRDGSPLEARELGGVTIDVCPSCQGIWLDKGELEAVAGRGSEDAITSWVRSLFGR